MDSLLKDNNCVCTAWLTKETESGEFVGLDGGPRRRWIAEEEFPECLDRRSAAERRLDEIELGEERFSYF